MQSNVDWIVKAIETMGETAVENQEYWRASYTTRDAAGVSQLKTYMEEAGMETYFDAVGNLFGRIPGRTSETIMSGSHRDTVRNGGKYDGMLGILTAICAVSELVQKLGQPERSVEVVAFCEEESSRFPTNYLGSRHICGELREENLQDLDDDGITLGEAMKASGYLQTSLAAQGRELERFIELHIEQGGLLEFEKKQIGVVSDIVGIFSGSIILKGQQNHAGTTPMSLRKDPVPVAAEYIKALHAWAEGYGDDLVCTVGKIDVKPGNANVIADTVELSFDIRSANLEYLLGARDFLERLKGMLEGDIRISVIVICMEPPVRLDAEGIHILEQLAEKVRIPWKKMVSGAGHDSQIMAQKYKTNMIFVPSVKGISHSPAEYTRKEDIEAGLLLLKAFLKETAW